MVEINNWEIINLLLERDKNSYYSKSSIFDDNNSYNPNTTIGKLIGNLCDASYQVSDSDVKLLEKYHIFIGNKQKKQNSFIVLSDFHGYRYPVDKIIEYYLDEYDYIYILGDVTDRGPKRDGTDSLDLLFKIKELSQKYPGRVIYVPGNHDSFIVGNYYNDYNSFYTMLVNGGEKTIEDLERLKVSNPAKYNDLIGWLGELPLQRMHQYNGQTYGLAHAFFIQKLFDKDPNYNLNKYFRNPKARDLGDRILWFRKKDFFSNKNIDDEKVSRNERRIIKELCPSSDVIVVIGHSKTKCNSREHDLVNKDGETVTVHCVDGGIAYNGTMLKYDGGEAVMTTKYHEHNDTSDGVYVSSADAILRNSIISSIYENREKSFERDLYFMPASITNDEFADIVDSYEKDDSFTYPFVDYQDRFCLFRKIFVLNIIMSGLLRRYDSVKDASYFMNGFILTGDSTYITRDYDLRFFAEMLGVDNIKLVLEAYNCSSVDDYFKLKVLSDVEQNAKIKV